jgi:SAM-dependent methyltransferase
MLLTLRTPEVRAGGFARLLRHGTEAVHAFDLPGGRAHLFRPSAEEVAVMLELDPVTPGARPSFRGYTAYSAPEILGSALGRFFASALADEDDVPQAVEVRVSVLPCTAGEAVFSRIFAPLGYAVHATRRPLDPEQPRAGQGWLYVVALSGRQRLRDVLLHLRILLPFFSTDGLLRESGAGAMELWAEGRPWLETHPEREMLERRLLGRAPPPELHDRRHEAVLAALKESGARRVLDLGCGTGPLLRRLLDEPQFDEVVGVEVERGALAQAAARLPPGGRGRVLHGSLAYRDARLAGFDAAAIVEVIEHLDPPQLAAFEGVVWETARPATVVVTTPNAEYNTLFEYHRNGRLRHPDHRFEWTRAEFRAWAEGVSTRHGYGVRFGAAGPEDARVGPLTQMAVFGRLTGTPAQEGAADARRSAGIDLQDVVGERTLATRLGGDVHVGAGEAAEALEAMSRFAADPRWLVYLPPDLPAAVAAPGTDVLEHPSAALAYYRSHGVTGVVLQDLHAGTRVAVVACRDEAAARRRFQAAGGETGAVYTASGRPFFATRAAEEAFLARLRTALDQGGLWEALGTDWVALEGVMGPGVPMMREVNPYFGRPLALCWTVAAAAGSALGAAAEALGRAAADGVSATDLLARTRARVALVEAYAAACRRNCLPARAPDELRFAPVLVLAGERGVYAERDPRWHQERLAPACQVAPLVLRGVEQRVVDLANPQSEAEAVAWSDAALARGSAGIVVRPAGRGPRGGSRFMAPALECRGMDVQRLVYGPEHALPEHRERLRVPGTGEPGVGAAKEWALSIEALERFVRGEPLARVHECVFAALAVKRGSHP